MKSKTGYKISARRWRDYDFHAVYGSAQPQPMIPLGRGILGIPLVSQGDQNTCVSCSATWVRQWMEAEHPDLSWEWLAQVSHTTQDGATFSQVLEAARKDGIATDAAAQANDGMAYLDAAKHKIGTYSFPRLDAQSLYQALKVSPLMIGVKDYQGSGPHCMVAYDVTDDGQRLKCVNWWDATTQSLAEVTFDSVVEAVAFNDSVIENNPTLPMLNVLKDKLSKFYQTGLGKAVLGLVGAILAVTGGYSASQNFGGAGIVAQYSATISGSGINTTDATIPVSTMTMKTGEVIYTNDPKLHFPIYLTIAPNDSNNVEIVECTGNNSSSTPQTWTGCNRGLSFKGGNTTSTYAGAAKSHPSGTSIIMSNSPYFYQQFIDNYSAQTKTGILTFNTYPRYVNSAVLPTNAAELATKAYVDGVGAGGFTAANVSTTLGLKATGSSPEKVGINASSTAGLAFDSAGRVYVNASSTDSTNGGFLKFTTLGKLYWDVVSFLAHAWTWTGAQTFGAVTLGGNVSITGAATSTGASFRVTAAPTIPNDVTNKNYTDLRVSGNYATGTANGTITAGAALWVTSSSTLRLTSSSAVSSTFQFVGVALAAAANGATVTYAKPGGTICRLSGLTPGMNYYLNGTAGQMALTPGTYQARIGRAVSATCLELMPPKFIISGTQTITSATTYVQTTYFYPAHVDIRAAISTKGWSVGDDTNSCVNNDTSFYSSSLAWHVLSTSACEGTVSAKSATTFTLSESAHHSTDSLLIYWTAYSE